MSKIVTALLRLVAQGLGMILVIPIVILFNLYLICHQKLGRMGILKRTIKGFPYKQRGRNG